MAVISSFPAFLETKWKLKMEEIEDDDELAVAYKDLTEYQFLISHYVISQGDNAPALEEMWRELRAVSESKGEGPNFKMFRRGIVTQVATYRVFEELGLHPKNATPEQDAYKKVDLWSDDEHAVQIKGSAIEKFGIYKTDEVSPTSVEISGGGGKRNVYDNDIRSFRTKVRSFGKNFKGYFIVIPSDMIDFTTGKPKQELIELVRQEVSPLKMAA